MNIHDVRIALMLDLFGEPEQWSDWEAILLCPLHWLPTAYRDGRYLAAKARHVTTLVEGMGQAIRERITEPV